VSLFCSYIRFIAGRAKGDILTGAAWQRQFVTSHPAYKHDSVVPPEICHDMLAAIKEIAQGRTKPASLLGALAPEPLVLNEAISHACFDCATPPVVPVTVSKRLADALAVLQAPFDVEIASGTASHTHTIDAASSCTTGTTSMASPTGSTVSASSQGSQQRSPGVRMRGRSFAEEVMSVSSKSLVIQQLLDRYTIKPGKKFEEVSPFLAD
jgi:hypothetical protein